MKAKIILFLMMLFIIICFFNTEYYVVYKTSQDKQIENSWMSVTNSSTKHFAILFYSPDFIDSSFAIYRINSFPKKYSFIGAGKFPEITHEICEIRLENSDESVIMSNNKLEITKVEFFLKEKQTLSLRADKPFVIVLPQIHGELIFYDKENKKYYAFVKDL